MLNKLKFYIALILPVLSVLFIATPAYAAGHTYTIYAYGSGYIMVGILKSIASVVASGGFSLILKSVVLIGFVIIFLQMIITSFKVSPHRSLVKYFAAVLVIYSALLIPKVNVYVYDTVNNTTSNATVVNNVPWGIGAIASYFSDFQYYMTTSIEQAFSTPNTIDLTNAGMGFALTSQNIVDGVQIDDPYLFQSFTQYVYNCVLPGISAGGLSSQALTQAGMSVTGTGDTTNSLLGYMASYTDGAGANLLTTEYSRSDPSGVTTTCGTQTGDIQTSFTNYATNDAGPQIAGALGMTYATFANEYGLVNSSIYSMSSNAEQEIIQMMTVNQYSQAMIQSANLAGVNPTQLAYGSALAQRNMSDSFSISGQMAGKYMPVVYGIFSALFLAFSLFLIILMALPIGVNYLKMYMELGLFLAVWPTLMAVYNYIIDLIIQQQFSYIATQGYSLNSAHTVNTFIATQLGWMGYLSWGVPMMAYALVTGSTYAMVGAISSMDSAGKKASGAAAAQAESGNVNLGNDSLSNYNANKHNSAVQDVTGVMPRTHYSGFKKMEQSANSDKLTDTGTGAFAEVGKGSSTVRAAGSNMIDGSIHKADISTASNSLSNAKSNAKSDQQSVSSSYGQTVASYNGLNSSDKTSVNKDWNLSNKKSVSNAAEFAHLSKGQMTSKNGVSLNAYMETQGGISALGDKAEAGLRLNLQHEFGMSKEQADSFTSKYQADQVQSLNNSLSKSHSTSIGKDSGFKNSVSDSVTAQNTYSAAESKVKSLQSSLSAQKSHGAQWTKKELPGFLTQYNKKHGLTGQAAATADVHLENQMGVGNKKDLKSFNDYLNNKSGIAKTQAKISMDGRGIITKNINPQTPVSAFNKNKPAAGGDYTPYRMIKTPSKSQRNEQINKQMQNSALLKKKALDYVSLMHKLHKLGLPPAINTHLGKAPTRKSIGKSIVGYSGINNTGLVAKTKSGLQGQIIINKQGHPAFTYKTPQGKTREALISGGKGPGEPETFTGKNGTIHTLEDEHFTSGNDNGGSPPDLTN